MTAPDPFREIRLLGVETVRGANFWSRGPVVRVDVHPGAYEEISSREVAGMPDALIEALPGLGTHRCSVGEPGGFLVRLRRGTYAPHIVEHVALELQAELGHDVSFGRARGGDRDGEYTVVFGYREPGVGRAAGHAAVDIVRRAFAGGPIDMGEVRATMRRAAEEKEPTWRPEAVDLLLIGGDPDRLARGIAERRPELAVAALRYPRLLREGLPYRSSRAAVIADLDGSALPPRYREAERLELLASVAADAVPDGGLVIVRAGSPELVSRIRDDGRHVGVFAPEGILSEGEARLAHAVAVAEADGLRIDSGGVERRLPTPDERVEPCLLDALLGARSREGARAPDRVSRDRATAAG